MSAITSTSPPDILRDICEYKRAEVAQAQREHPLEEIYSQAERAAPPRGFAHALHVKRQKAAFGLIAEIKKASPSKGVIRADFDPAAHAASYAAGGASCLSVLTDTPSFCGSGADLVAARAAVELPVLRKDFMISRYQVVEARAWGADCILVILAMLTDRETEMLMAEAARWGMDVLVEVHDRNEMARAAALGATLIGMNNRDLRRFVTDLSVSEDLAKIAPDNALLVAESGLSTTADLQRMADAGITCFLVGESLMRKPDLAAATAELLGTDLGA